MIVGPNVSEEIYKILILDCKAPNDSASLGRFTFWAYTGCAGKEYRFGGIFGLSGKIWIETPTAFYPNTLRVSGPNSSELEKYSEETRELIVKSLQSVNQKLQDRFVFNADKNTLEIRQ